VYEEEFAHGWAKTNEPFFIYSGQKGVGVYRRHFSILGKRKLFIYHEK
jgi:hypothetical protein